MDPHAYHVLEFDAALEVVAGHTTCEHVRRHLRGIEPSADLSTIRQRQALCGELMADQAGGVDVPRLTVPDLGPVLKKVRPENSVLAAEELIECRKALATARMLAGFARHERRPNDSPIRRLVQSLCLLPEVRQALDDAFDDDGDLQDSASSALHDLRRRMRRVSSQIRLKLEGILRAAWADDILQEKFVTIRNGRHVLPVRREMKTRLPGVVHDHSDSGRTVFMEPSQTLPLGNELADLILEERDECRRILAELSSRIRCSRDRLDENEHIMLRFACAAAIARWGVDYHCTQPRFADTLVLRQARHPLLEHQFRSEGSGDRIVPLNLSLDNGVRTLVVTGANSGGKTVTLKTVGLLVLLAHAGFPVPVDDLSTFRLCDCVFADIGDEQSLARSLSTFTGHLQHIKHILDRLDEQPGQNVLVLLDELGTGTDPLEGAALGCTVLEELAGHGAWTIATTHLDSIKRFVHERPDMINAAVRFNIDTLQPEYALDIGSPGSSHALRIARRLGINADLLERARSRIGTEQRCLDDMLAEIEEERGALERNRHTLEKSLEQARNEQCRLQAERNALKAERKQKLHAAYREAEGIVANTRARMERLLADLARCADAAGNAAAKHAAHVAREVMDRRQEHLAEAAQQTQPRPVEPAVLEDLNRGDHVWVETLGENAEVVRVLPEREQAVVRSGHLEFTVSASLLGQTRRDKPAPAQPRVGAARPPIARTARPEINLIGCRAEDARQRLQRYLDTAALADFAEIRVIHGLGAGILKATVHDVLAERQDVASYREGIEGRDSGGAGVTIVAFDTK